MKRGKTSSEYYKLVKSAYHRELRDLYRRVAEQLADCLDGVELSYDEEANERMHEEAKKLISKVSYEDVLEYYEIAITNAIIDRAQYLGADFNTTDELFILAQDYSESESNKEDVSIKSIVDVIERPYVEISIAGAIESSVKARVVDVYEWTQIRADTIRRKMSAIDTIKNDLIDNVKKLLNSFASAEYFSTVLIRYARSLKLHKAESFLIAHSPVTSTQAYRSNKKNSFFANVKQLINEILENYLESPVTYNSAPFVIAAAIVGSQGALTIVVKELALHHNVVIAHDVMQELKPVLRKYAYEAADYVKANVDPEQIRELSSDMLYSPEDGENKKVSHSARTVEHTEFFHRILNIVKDFIDRTDFYDIVAEIIADYVYTTRR